MTIKEINGIYFLVYLILDMIFLNDDSGELRAHPTAVEVYPLTNLLKDGVDDRGYVISI